MDDRGAGSGGVAGATDEPIPAGNGGQAGSPPGEMGGTTQPAPGGQPGGTVDYTKEPMYLPPEAEGEFDFSGKQWILGSDWKSMAGETSGRVVTDTFQSSGAFPGRSYRYRLWIPGDLPADAPAPIMVWQDGSNLWQLGSLHRLYANLVNRDQLPPTVNIFVDPSSIDNRGEEYDGVGDRYARLLIDELIPAAARKHGFTVTTDPEGHGIGGQSSGGAAAFTAAWHRPQYFRRVLTCNGSFVALRGADRYPELVRTTNPPKPLRVFLLSGDMDLGAFGGWGPANKRLAAALEERDYRYRMIYAKEIAHEYPHCFYTIAWSLRFVWHGYAPK